MTLNDLLTNSEISLNTYGFCKHHKFHSLFYINKYYSTNKTFQNLLFYQESIGNELIDLCLKNFEIPEINELESPIENQYLLNFEIKELNELQLISINKFIILKYSNLSARIKSSLYNYLDGNININYLLNEIYYKENFQIDNISDVGRKSVPEIEIFLQSIIEFCNKINNFEGIGLEEELNNLNPNHCLINIKVDELDELQLNLINKFITANYYKLSVRCRNGLNNYLESEINFDSLLKKVFNNDNFQIANIRNLGQRSIPEVERFFYNIKEYCFKICKFEKTEIEEEFYLLNSIKLSPTNIKLLHQQIIANYISGLTNQLSNRSRNAINQLLSGQLDFNEFYTVIFSNEHFKVENIQNIGLSSITEIRNYIEKIKLFSIDIISIEDDEKLKQKAVKSLLEIQFPKIDFNIYSNLTNNIFKLIEILIDFNEIFRNTETYILKKTLNIYTDSKSTDINTIIYKTGLTKERIRQIKETILKKIVFELEFLSNFNIDDLLRYKIDNSISFIEITTEKGNYINKIDETKFSKQFQTLIISNFLKKSHELIGNINDVMTFKEIVSKNRHNWKNFYLIKNELYFYFDFNKFVDEVDRRINERTTETYYFNFKSFISKFFKIEMLNNLDELSNICESILNNEFDIYLNFNGNIVFERKTLKTLPEYAYEALEELGKPSHIDEINIQIQLMNLGFSKKISGANLKQKDGFISFSKTSSFGLKKWEKESEGIKGGTIKKIISDYLELKKVPIHLVEIMNEISKYRQTSFRSVIQNLKLDPEKGFLFFNQNFIGLKKIAREYDNEKYNNLPIQLGKKIVSGVSKGEFTNSESIINFIISEYHLSKEEAENILYYFETNVSTKLF